METNDCQEITMIRCEQDERGGSEPAVHGAEVNVQGLPPGAIVRGRVAGN